MTEDDSLLLPEEEMFEHFRFVSDKGQGLLRVDKYITEHMEQVSRHRVQLAIDAGSDKMRAFGQESALDVRVMHEDIFNAMHRI